MSSAPMLYLYGRPNQFALIRFLARSLDHSASFLIPYNLEPRVSHPKESELHLTASFSLVHTYIRYDTIRYGRLTCAQ